MSQESGSDTQVRQESAAPTVEVASEANLPAQTEKSAAKSKVELDIEDAPFLKEEPSAAKAPDGSQPKEEEDEATLAKKKKKKRLIIIGAAALLVLIIAAVVAFFLLKGEPPAPPPPSVEELKPNVIVVPSKPTVKTLPDVVRDFDLFIIPVGENTPTTKFLVCKFSAVSKSPAMNNELDHKMLVLRDAIYFYLRGKDPAFILDVSNAAELKHDLVDILNDYLQRAKLDDVLLDSYLAY
ncbi:MAG: flagellar basal body-associated FliL family protein [Desulfovibrionaceae bacterium]|nr:flagellar basal body-associated FliL family protein [Desulfovibrionaceae bacterium]